MKILVIADEESQKIWDFFRKEDYADIDLVISCGDLCFLSLFLRRTLRSARVVRQRTCIAKSN